MPEENTLIIYLTSWNEKELRIIFLELLQFCYKQGSIISNFYEIKENTPFFKEALSHQYVKLSPDQPYKLFQIWDIDDFPFIEVVARVASITKGNTIVGFKS